MLSLVKFNYLRLLNSKFFLAINILLVVFSMIIYFIWVNVDTEMFMHWISIALLIVYLVVVNISGLAAVMVNDLQNGVFSLEIRKGLPYQAIMWMKLLVLKSLIWFMLAFIMLLFFVITITSNSNKYDQLISNHIPGLTAMFALDIFFTGIGLLVGSFLNTKLLSALLAFIAVPMVLSQSLATIHLQGRDDVNITSKVDWYPFLKIQQLGQSNPNGLVAFLYKELGFYNNDFLLQTTEKPVDPEATDPSTYLSYKDIQSLNEKNGKDLLRQFLLLGQPFMLANYFNADPYLNKAASYELSQEYKDSLIYKFFEDTYYDPVSDASDRDSKLNYGNGKNADHSDLLIGSDKLAKYVEHLQMYNFQQIIINKYKFTNYYEELETLLEIMQQIILNGSYIITNTYQYSTNSEVSFNNDDAYFKNLENSGVQTSYWRLNEWEKALVKKDLWLSEGNQIFVRLLVNIIGYTASFTPNIENNLIKNSVNELIEKNASTRRLIYARNPFMSFPYMTLYTSHSKNPLVNINASKLISPGGLPIQDLKISANLEPDDSQNYFKAVDKLKVNGGEASKLVFDAWIFYLWYIAIGLTLGLASHFIYIRKVKP